MSKDSQHVEAEIAVLEARLADLKARLPAHSVSPALIAELDELDECLEELHALQQHQKNRTAER